MQHRNFAMMSIDELWILDKELRSILSAKLEAEKRQLEHRLARLQESIGHEKKARRPYPKVHQKYRNPEKPSETWSGRGKQPHWLGAILRSGVKIDALLVPRTH